MKTSTSHALNGMNKLPVNFRIVWIAKIQAIRNGNWDCTRTADVSSGFRYSDRRANFRVHIHIARIAIHRQRQRFLCATNADDRRIRWPVGGPIQCSDHAVVLFPHPALGSDIRIFNELLCNGLGLFDGRNRNGIGIPGLRLSVPCWL